MNIFASIDAAGYVESWGSSLEGENVVALDTTENPFEGKNFRAFKWDGEKIVYDQARQDALIEEYEAAKAANIPDSERIKTLEKENELLKLQVDVQSNQYQFLEDVVTEIILTTQN